LAYTLAHNVAKVFSKITDRKTKIILVILIICVSLEMFIEAMRIMKIKYAATIYNIGVYVSLALISISLLLSFALPTEIGKEHVKLDFSNFLNSILSFDPLAILYLAALILVFSPIATIIYLLFYFALSKKYVNFLITLILILIFSSLVLIKVV